jgi:hypothetical protein
VAAIGRAPAVAIDTVAEIVAVVAAAIDAKLSTSRRHKPARGFLFWYDSNE